ncbi:hypothetical protein ACQ4LE_007285 [Meloidogyne hapla]
MNTCQFINKIISSPLLFCFLVLCIIAGDRTATASTPLSHPKFFLSCRVIAGICQGDIRCLEEMGTRFPNCYLESLLERGSDIFARELEFDEGPNERQRVPDKRAPAFKLMKVLMMKDRIPVGRR